MSMVGRARLLLLWSALALLALVGCTTAGGATPPATVGLSNPKSLATVYISPTPDLPQEQSSPAPTFTPQPAGGQPTATATPYIGIFLGAASGEEIEGLITPAAVAPLPTQPRASGGACTISPAPPLNMTWAANPLLQQRLGCPVNAGFGLRLVYQPFERGHMFWRDTGEIYALSEQSIRQGSATDTFWRMADTWQEGQPESDPGFSPPDGLRQPIRGFGNAWRSNEGLRNALGWAVDGERWFDSFWQDFEHGWMMVGPDGRIFALVPSDVNTGVHFGALPGG